MKALNPNPWTARELPILQFLNMTLKKRRKKSWSECSCCTDQAKSLNWQKASANLLLPPHALPPIFPTPSLPASLPTLRMSLFPRVIKHTPFCFTELEKVPLFRPEIHSHGDLRWQLPGHFTWRNDSCLGAREFTPYKTPSESCSLV